LLASLDRASACLKSNTTGVRLYRNNPSTSLSKRTRILDFTPASLNMAASSKNATPRYSTLFISRTRATSTAPCPYASAFIIAIIL